MSFIIKGGVAVVTGAGSGIGRALAEDLAQRGAALALTDRDAQSLSQTAASCSTHNVVVSEHVFDIADADAITALPEAVLAAHGRVTMLFNNAGVGLAGTFNQTNLTDFEWLMAINFWGPVRMCKAFMPALQSAPAAHIVNISSLFGLIAPEGQAAYCASKFGIRGFSESLRHELADSSIGLTIVHPGGVRTSIARNTRIPSGANSPDLQDLASKFEAFLVMPPAQAANIILEGVARRAPRVLIGSDARKGDILQRLLPGTYWRHMKKSLQRTMR